MGNREWGPPTGMGTRTRGKILNGDGGWGACPRPDGDPLPSLLMASSFKNHSLITTKVILSSHITTLFVTYMDPTRITSNIIRAKLILQCKDFPMFISNLVIKLKAILVQVIFNGLNI